MPGGASRRYTSAGVLSTEPENSIRSLHSNEALSGNIDNRTLRLYRPCTKTNPPLKRDG